MVKQKHDRKLKTKRKLLILLLSLKQPLVAPVKKFISHLHRKARRLDWHNLRSTQPIARKFGFYRGKPIDRYYIENFLNKNRHFIQGRILEVSNDGYSKRFAINAQSIHILHANSDNPKATMVADLTKSDSLPKDAFDCFICTQTLQFIYNISAAVQNICQILRPGGVVLLTVPGISQISPDDNKRWGDYWRFTELSLLRLFSEVFGKENVHVECYGNVLSSIAFLEGLSVSELTPQELDHKDSDYQMLLTVVARKAVSDPSNA
jgi:SAM-dependent methyltransferase